MRPARAVVGGLLACSVALAACGGGESALDARSLDDRSLDDRSLDDPAIAEPVPSTTTTVAPTATTSTTEPDTATSAASEALAQPRPDWLGTRVLPVDEDGFGQILPTPPELADRRLETVDHLPPPSDTEFVPTVESVPDAVLARSTWSPDCPVAASDLRYVTLPFHGFDGELHTGELLLHADAVDAVVAGFAALFADAFPIEEMRIVASEELDLAPTGDGNNTTAFVCRPVRGSRSWSEHAYGRAVDINPFHNPYVKGDLVLPELASAYVDRTWERPGMLHAADVDAFVAQGWGWGGSWSSLKDHMHVSQNGR